MRRVIEWFILREGAEPRSVKKQFPICNCSAARGITSAPVFGDDLLNLGRSKGVSVLLNSGRGRTTAKPSFLHTSIPIPTVLVSLAAVRTLFQTVGPLVIPIECLAAALAGNFYCCQANQFQKNNCVHIH